MEEPAHALGRPELIPEVRRHIPVNVLVVAIEDDVEFLGIGVVTDGADGR